MKPFIVVDGVCYISETEIKRAMSGEGLSGDSWKLFKDGNYELTSTAEAKATLDRIKEAVSKAVQAGYQLITKEFKGNQYAAGFALPESQQLVSAMGLTEGFGKECAKEAELLERRLLRLEDALNLGPICDH